MQRKIFAGLMLAHLELLSCDHNANHSFHFIFQLINTSWFTNYFQLRADISIVSWKHHCFMMTCSGSTTKVQANSASLSLIASAYINWLSVTATSARMTFCLRFTIQRRLCKISKFLPDFFPPLIFFSSPAVLQCIKSSSRENIWITYIAWQSKSSRKLGK